MEKKKIYKKRSQTAAIFRRLRKNKLAMAGAVVLLVLILLAIFADVIADYSTDVIGHNMEERLQKPSAEHWFGTDQYGRDVFARIVHGTRISLSLALFSMLVAVALGAILGAVSAYYGGTVDEIIMRIMDVLMSIPPMLMSITIVAALGQNMINLMVALSIAYIPLFARVIRSSILSIKGQEFIEAAKCCGTSDARIIFKHILPNAVGPILVQSTLAMGSVILTISSLSFIGLGVKPPQPEWGTMLYDARTLFRHQPYLSLFPGVIIAITVLSLNMLGDGFRDAIDPRLKN
jgi:peptide/nickel transport system permease protein